MISWPKFVLTVVGVFDRCKLLLMIGLQCLPTLVAHHRGLVSLRGLGVKIVEVSLACRRFRVVCQAGSCSFFWFTHVSSIFLWC